MSVKLNVFSKNSDCHIAPQMTATAMHCEKGSYAIGVSKIVLVLFKSHDNNP